MANNFNVINVYTRLRAMDVCMAEREEKVDYGIL